jgi:hypothetical protein
MATTTYVNKRTAHRWRLLALMLAGVFFAFGSFWLVQVMRGGGDAHNVNVGNDPDYIIDNFSFVRMSEDRPAALRDLGRAPDPPPGRQHLGDRQAGGAEHERRPSAHDHDGQ